MVDQVSKLKQELDGDIVVPASRQWRSDPTGARPRRHGSPHVRHHHRIPLGLASFKQIPASLTPFGRDIVDLAQARRLGYATQVAMPADASRPSN